MKSSGALQRFKQLLAGPTSELSTLSVPVGVEAMLAFYSDERAVDCMGSIASIRCSGERKPLV
jgi:hypothetical protein